MLCNRDLNFWGFDALSHPLNGLMMTEFRPVNCYTQQPLDFLPADFFPADRSSQIAFRWQTICCKIGFAALELPLTCNVCYPVSMC